MGGQTSSTRLRGCLSRLVVPVLGIVAALLVLEVAARILYNRAVRRLEAEVAADPNSPYHLFRPDPELGWSHVPGSSVLIDDSPGVDPFSVHIDAHGLNDRDYAYERPANGFRVLVVGDSFVEGLQLPSWERSFQQLEDRYAARSATSYEIIEAGVMRHSPNQYYIYYTQDGWRYKADLVIVVIFLGNDLEEMHPNSGHHLIPGLGATRTWFYTVQNGELIRQRQADWHPPRRMMPVPMQAHALLTRHSLLYTIISQALLDHPGPREALIRLGLSRAQMPEAARLQAGYEDGLYAEVWPILEALLVAFRDRAEAEGSRFAVVIAPERYAIYPDDYFAEHPAFANRRADFEPHKLERRLVEILERHAIPYLSLTPALQEAARTSEQRLYTEVHWTPAGHDVVTEALDRWFQSQGWAP